jgi:hypothetical protein
MLKIFMRVRFSIFSSAFFLLAFSLTPGWAQSSGTVEGTVADPSGAVIPNAAVEIHNPVSGYSRSATTDSSGRFRFPNVPYNPYHLSVTVDGFNPTAQDVEVRSGVPVTANVSLTVAGSASTVTVEGTGNDLVENESTFHTDVDRNLFEKMPMESPTSSLNSMLTLSTPGVAADSNNQLHGLGDHAENAYYVDGQPDTDQHSKVFSNQIPLDSIQSLEVISGAPPAEYGGKTSVVVVATTRSGQGVTPPHGSVTASYGSFGTSNVGIEVAYGGKSWGNFISASGSDSGRFLDTPEFVVMHDRGNVENFFDRADYQLSAADSFRLGLSFTRSWFQTPNSFDSEFATPWQGVVVDSGGIGPNGLPVGPADQRSQIKTFNIAPSWTRLLSSSAVFTLAAFVRRDGYNYYPSNNPFADLGPTDLQRETVGQERTLTNAGLRSDLSYVKGINNIKVGATYEQTLLNENDNLGIVDPTLLASLTDSSGAACVNANGVPITAPCTTLAPYDLTRGGSLYFFHGHADVKELALYAQDTITKGSWTLNAGLRGDFYNGITTARQAEPRLGISYKLKPSNTVLRISYARTLETPFNENLVLSSIGCSNPVLNPLLACSAAVPNPLSPGFRNEFHAGIEQAFGRYLVFSGEYIWKYTHNAYDFSVLGNTPITFPIEWNNSKIPGFAGRVSVPNFHGFSALVVFSSVAARFFTPQIGGAGSVPSAVGAFRIDHDEKFNQTTHLQYQPWKQGPWLGFNWRYDSGLVAGPAPCAGGDCANGPAGSDSVVDVSRLSPDQQFEAGLFCGSVHAAPPTATSLGTPISPTGLCPASQYGSTLLQIPAAGSANDDTNPPRVASRNLFDLALGDDNLLRGDKYKWSLQLTAVNITNKYALYNFLSTFSGTHYVTPRTYTAELGFHF